MLPKLEFPIYTTTLPASNKNIRFRPFNMSEQTNILISAETGSWQTALKSLVELSNLCTFNEIDVGNLEILDFEWIILKMRMVSVGEELSLKYKCHHKNEDGKICGGSIEFDVNLSTSVKQFPAKTKKLVQIRDDVFAEISKITPNILIQLDGTTDTGEILNAITDSVIQGSEVFREFSKEEILKFYSKVPAFIQDSILECFDDTGHLKIDEELTCPHCGNKGRAVVEGVLNFFV